jgi:hypothetical protein
MGVLIGAEKAVMRGTTIGDLPAFFNTIGGKRTFVAASKADLRNVGKGWWADIGWRRSAGNVNPGALARPGLFYFIQIGQLRRWPRRQPACGAA